MSTSCQLPTASVNEPLLSSRCIFAVHNLIRQTPAAPRFDHTSAINGDLYLLIFGGCSHSIFFNDLLVLDSRLMLTVIDRRPSDVFQNDRPNSVTIGVADEYIGLVVGRGGRNIMEIIQNSGARIKISDRGGFMSGTNESYGNGF
ncbi:hypothetical protein POTOM_030902 [Populus tomentosa]|uniref:K Homology domain-containing protein n=1 Tax=Populus tomentosa TaxID=118781 RepID=A0A8X7Z7C7_POPTO|nr:hypothetical protein POTOM_030902 [Populus tomentosa]